MNYMERENIKKIEIGIKQGDVEDVMTLIDEDQLKKVMPFGTWLHAAAEHGQLEIVNRLVAKGADVNAQGGA
jgi:hypothetical protein